MDDGEDGGIPDACIRERLQIQHQGLVPPYREELSLHLKKGFLLFLFNKHGKSPLRRLSRRSFGRCGY